MAAIYGFDYYVDLINEQKDLIESKREITDQINNLDHQDLHLREQLREQLFNINTRIQELSILKIKDNYK